MSEVYVCSEGEPRVAVGVLIKQELSAFGHKAIKQQREIADNCISSVVSAASVAKITLAGQAFLT